MAVTIQIGVDRLNDPSVAKALANLVLALGGAATGQKKPAEAPAPKPEAPSVEAPAEPAAPVVEAAAEPAPKKTRKPRKAAPAKAPEAKAEAPAEAAAPAAPAADDVAARYEAFVENLPERSRAFLDLLKQRGTLTINEAMEALDISVPKAMGGITGSIGRWAPVRGVPVPYEASMVDGVRTWTWTGGPEGASPAPAAPVEAPKKTRKARASKSDAGAKKGKGKTSKKSSAKKAAAPAPAKADDGDLAQRYRDFVANLPERSQQFIELVRERKTLTISDAMDALGLTVPKAMGGITGSIGRWAPVRGIPVPYEATTIDGERAWTWLGAPTDDEGGASPKAEAPAGVTPEASAPEGAIQEENDQAAIEAVIAELPERASLFVRTLRQRELMTMQEVLETFSLAKARAVSGIVDPIFTAFRDADVAPPFEATFAPTGEKAWVWAKPASAQADEEPPAEDPADARGMSSARPGVRVRRRAR